MVVSVPAVLITLMFGFVGVAEPHAQAPTAPSLHEKQLTTREWDEVRPDAPYASSEPVLKSFRLVEITGDGDGFPDTNETLDLYVSLRNPTRSQDLSNVEVVLTAEGPKIDCLVPSVATIPSLPAGTETEIATPFLRCGSSSVDGGLGASTRVLLRREHLGGKRAHHCAVPQPP